MFCQFCGKKLAQSLLYCPQCGKNLQKKTLGIREQKIALYLFLVVNILGGLAVIVMLAGVLKQVVGLDNGLIILFMGLSFMAVIGVQFVLARQLMLLQQRESSSENEVPNFRQDENKTLETANPLLLHPTPASVAEGTTEILPAVSKELKTNRL